MKSSIYVYLREGRRGRERPRITTAVLILKQARRFINFMMRRGLTSLSRARQDDYMAYVTHLKQTVTRRQGRPISALTIEKHLLAVELLGQLSGAAGFKMERPWPHSSAKLLSGVPSQGGPRVAKTPVIPERALRTIFQASVQQLERGSSLLDMRDGVAAISRSAVVDPYRRRITYLREQGWLGNYGEFQRALLDIRTACYVIIATLSGCRNHEIGFIENDACFSTVTKDGERTWWFRSVSTKTHVGKTEWMIPELAVKAIRLMERWATPFQAKIEKEIRGLRKAGRGAELAEAMRHRRALFLCSTGSTARTMRAINMCAKLREFARKQGIDWPFTTHQFRRTFAVTAARSSFGDLRYLKEHFKHWSMDMTLLYAAAGVQEKELLDEVSDELEAIQLGVLSNWLSPSTRLTGGGAKGVKRFREENPIRMYPSRSAMVKLLSNEVHLRSNGHAWCTADNGRSCIGATSFHKTRCVDCTNSIIGEEHAAFYRKMAIDLEQLLEIEDIGQSGRARVMRDIARCERVLAELGGQNKGEKVCE